MDFHSFILISPKSEEVVNSLVTKEWRLSTSPDPSKRFWQSVDDQIRSTFRRAEFRGDIEAKMSPAIEIVIAAENVGVATNVQQMIHGGMLLGYPCLGEIGELSTPIEYGILRPDVIENEPFCNYFHYAENGEFGCQIAKAVWHSRALIYAIEKLKLSWRLDSFTPHSASPGYGQIFENEHAETVYHTKAAFAIIAAHSVIEELKLEVRSSSKKKRFLDNDTGTWNPDVFGELEKRLIEAGVNLSKNFLWVYRGEPTEVENSMKPVLGVLAKYSDGAVVRDREMHVIDAIHYVGYLRNFLAAHKFAEIIRTISPYDVFNTQDLARRLLLESIGFWKHPDYFAINDKDSYESFFEVDNSGE